MKSYGANKATEFTRKQIGIIYRMAKNNEIAIEKWVINEFYNLAEYYGYDDNGSVAEAEGKILAILDAVFSGDAAKAQALINQYTEKEFSLLSRKNQQAADRNMIGSPAAEKVEDETMKAYVVEEYRDKAGTGTEKVFTTETEAVEHAKKEWEHLTQHDKKSYLKDPAGVYRVYEVEITSEQLQQYDDGELEITLDELWSRDILDLLEV